MKKNEKEYIDSYDRPEGCLAVAVGAVVMMLLSSVALNIILLVKIAQMKG